MIDVFDSDASFDDNERVFPQGLRTDRSVTFTVYFKPKSQLLKPTFISELTDGRRTSTPLPVLLRRSNQIDMGLKFMQNPLHCDVLLFILISSEWGVYRIGEGNSR